MHNNYLVTKPSTRDCIKNTFLEMYEEKPLKKITVSDLIKACNISRGTFYFHFEDIYTLYRECEQDMVAFMEEGLSDLILSTVRKDANKHLEATCRYMTKTYINKIDLFKCFLNGSEKESFRQKWFNSIHLDFAKAIEFANEMPLAKRDYLASFYAGGYVAVVGDWILEDCKEPVEDFADLQVQVLFRGIIS